METLFPLVWCVRKQRNLVDALDAIKCTIVVCKSILIELAALTVSAGREHQKLDWPHHKTECQQFVDIKNGGLKAESSENIEDVTRRAPKAVSTESMWSRCWF
jgi:hypothetical protein